MNPSNLPPGAGGYQESVIEVPRKLEDSCTKAEREFQEHLTSLKIKLEDGSVRPMVERRKRDVSGKWIYLCYPCGATCSGESILQTHILGKRHKNKIQRIPMWPLSIFADHPNLQIVAESGTANRCNEESQQPQEYVPPPPENDLDRQFGKYKDALCNIQKALDAVKAPLVGLEYLIEHPPEEEFHECKYFCTLCCKQGHPGTIINHITCYWHRMTYISRHFVKSYERLEPFKSQMNRRQGVSVVLSRLVQRIEDTYGRKRPILMDKELYDTNKDRIHQWLFKQEHFGDKEGRTFEEVVDIELIESLSYSDNQQLPHKSHNEPSTNAAPEKHTINNYIQQRLRARRAGSNDVMSDISDDLELLIQRDNAAKNEERSRKRDKASNQVTSFHSKYALRNDTPSTPFHEKTRHSHYVYKTKLAKEQCAAAEEFAKKSLAYHQKNPEKHPLYPEEWRKFWNKRYKEIQAAGQDPSKHNFKPEWIVFWTARMKELHDEELRVTVTEIYRKLCLTLPDVMKLNPEPSQITETRHNTDRPLRSPPEKRHRLPELHSRTPESLRLDKRRRSPDTRHRSPDTQRRSPDSRRQLPDTRRGSPDTRRRSSDIRLYSPDTRRHSPDTRRSSPGALRRSTDTRRRSPDALLRSPDTRRRLSSTLHRSPDSRRRSPDTRRRSPDIRRRSPVSLRRSPDARRRSPDSRRRSPDIRRRSPDLRSRSPAARRHSPDRRRRSPDTRLCSPESRRRSLDARRRSPDTLRRSPDTRLRSPDSRRRSPNIRRRSPDTRRRSPDSQHRSSDILRRSSDTRRRSPDTRRRSQELRRRSPMSQRRRSPDTQRDSDLYRSSPLPRKSSEFSRDRRHDALSPRNSDNDIASMDSMSARSQVESHASRSYPRAGRSAVSESGEIDDVIGTLRLLVALEDYLGSLGPKLIDLLAEALKMEKEKANSSEELLVRESAVVLIETAKEKLKGAVQAGLVSGSAAAAARSAVVRAAAMLHEADKRTRAAPNKQQALPATMSKQSAVPVAGVDKVDRAQIAQQIAEALIAQGKADVSLEELEQLVDAVVRMAEAKKREGEHDRAAGSLPKVTGTALALQILQSAYEENDKKKEKEEDVDAMDGLSDSDLDTLLKNFNELSAEEQHSLIAYLEKLETREPLRVERLRQYLTDTAPAPALASASAPAFGSAPASAFGSAPASAFGSAPASAFGSAPVSAFGSAPVSAYGPAPTSGSAPVSASGPASVSASRPTSSPASFFGLLDKLPTDSLQLESDDDDYAVEEVFQSATEKVKENQMCQKTEIAKKSLENTVTPEQSSQQSTPYVDDEIVKYVVQNESSASGLFALMQASIKSTSAATPVSAAQSIEAVASSKPRSFIDWSESEIIPQFSTKSKPLLPLPLPLLGNKRAPLLSTPQQNVVDSRPHHALPHEQGSRPLGDFNGVKDSLVNNLSDLSNNRFKQGGQPFIEPSNRFPQSAQDNVSQNNPPHNNSFNQGNQLLNGPDNPSTVSPNNNNQAPNKGFYKGNQYEQFHQGHRYVNNHFNPSNQPQGDTFSCRNLSPNDHISRANQPGNQRNQQGFNKLEEQGPFRGSSNRASKAPEPPNNFGSNGQYDQAPKPDSKNDRGQNFDTRQQHQHFGGYDHQNSFRGRRGARGGPGGGRGRGHY